jgi:putative ABC transport system permease protein
MGLYGLITFSIERREKEIGIRKANGAVTYNIVLLLIKEFIKLVVIGYFIAIPLSYIVMNKWLENFAYKINLNYIPFIVTLFILIGISLLAIIFKSVKASLKNPVDILRYE